MTDGKTEQSARTRQALISAAEELIALHGVSAVSSRQISKAAGQGNNYAVGHHFGSKDDLIRATLDRHNASIDRLRQKALDAIGPDPEVRDWIRCLVCPEIEYVGGLGAPTYFARFFANVSSDPATTILLYEKMGESKPLLAILEGLYGALPEFPGPVLEIRNNMTRHVIVNILADIERAADSGDRPVTPWQHQCSIVVDALTGMWLAPVTPTTATENHP
ncbi:TetR/AcrR family transcriptional regulator [Gordonia alkanivorans]|uniref:TetR/AcrR family transcriptional regulator n=1 Tax=Gordonia alkanivorans TaxID=84096 RepID=UPI000FDE8664|nr:TetR/AcrR family transcriptional regulator [Gordonia alkanivorans]AZZ80613.1 TetR family transcriptional regulator [Gordonia alkanivorans]